MCDGLWILDVCWEDTLALVEWTRESENSPTTKSKPLLFVAGVIGQEDGQEMILNVSMWDWLNRMKTTMTVFQLQSFYCCYNTHFIEYFALSVIFRMMGTTMEIKLFLISKHQTRTNVNVKFHWIMILQKSNIQEKMCCNSFCFNIKNIWNCQSEDKKKIGQIWPGVQILGKIHGKYSLKIFLNRIADIWLIYFPKQCQLTFLLNCHS